MEKPKLPRGRPAVPDAERLKILVIRVTDAQRAKIDAAGLAALRKLIDRWRPK